MEYKYKLIEFQNIINDFNYDLRDEENMKTFLNEVPHTNYIFDESTRMISCINKKMLPSYKNIRWHLNLNTIPEDCLISLNKRQNNILKNLINNDLLLNNAMYTKKKLPSRNCCANDFCVIL